MVRIRRPFICFEYSAFAPDEDGMAVDEEADSMAGQVVLITGSTAGLGLHAAKTYYKRGATVLLTCRDHIRGRNAVYEVQSCVERSKADARKESAAGDSSHAPVDVGRIHLFELDLTDYRSMLQFAEEVKATVPAIDVLVCNAGVMGLPFELSGDGVERHLHSNHLGHFMLINQLLPLLAASPSARVIVVTSGLYKRATTLPSARQLMGEELWDYDARTAYAVSKLANCMYTIGLAKRLASTHPSIGVYAVRPGFVRGTELGRETHWLLRKLAAPLIWLVSRSIDTGITGYVHTATAPKSSLRSGGLYFDRREETYEPTVTESEADHLWRISLQMEELVVRRRETLTDDERRLFQEGRKRLPA